MWCISVSSQRGLITLINYIIYFFENGNNEHRKVNYVVNCHLIYFPFYWCKNLIIMHFYHKNFFPGGRINVVNVLFFSIGVIKRTRFVVLIDYLVCVFLFLLFFFLIVFL